MFTIKATYRGQTRKASFTDLAAFPSHSDIVAQVSRYRGGIELDNELIISLDSPPLSHISRLLFIQAPVLA